METILFLTPKTIKMKKSLNLLTLTFLSVFFLPGCHVDNAKVVETEKETTECVVGKWVPENEDKELNNLEFHASNVEDGKSGTVNLSGGVEESNGTWQYQDIGEIEISTMSSGQRFNLLDCKRGILDGLTIYVKQ
jgi:hypothetical protein